MKKLFYIVLLVMFVPFKGFSQTKIYLIPPQGEFDDFTFVNASDSVYVKIEHSEDMGYKYAQRYSLKSNISDGEYEVYVNDTIGLRGFIKDFKRDSIWITYVNRKGKNYIHNTTPYKEGKINGEVVNYNEDGVVTYKVLVIDGKPVGIGTYFYDSGKIKGKNYFENGLLVKQEVFEENGEIKTVYYPPNTKRRKE